MIGPATIRATLEGSDVVESRTTSHRSDARGRGFSRRLHRLIEAAMEPSTGMMFSAGHEQLRSLAEFEPDSDGAFGVQFTGRCGRDAEGLDWVTCSDAEARSRGRVQSFARSCPR